MGIVGRKLLCDVGKGCFIFVEMGTWDCLAAMLLLLSIIGVIMLTMARTKIPKVGKASGSSVERAVKKRKPNPTQPVKKGKGKRHVSESESEESDDELEAMFEEEHPDERDIWVQSLVKRGFHCERSIEVGTFLFTHRIREVIEEQRLQFLSKPLEGYHPSVVREFYSNLREHSEIEYHMETTVGGKTFLVGTSSIAAALEYPRLSQSEGASYPFRPLAVFNGARVSQAACSNPVPMVSFNRNEFTPGKLKPEYALMNKIIHCSIIPKGKEKTPRVDEIRFLFEVMNGGQIDYAAVIWGVMKDFLKFSNVKTYMPYPCLVTQLVKAEGIKLPPKSKISPPHFGPITNVTEARSIAASARPKAAPSQSQSSSSTLQPASTSALKRMERRIKGWFKCILGEQKKIGHRLSRLEKEVHLLRGDPSSLNTPLPNLEGDSDELDDCVDEDDFSEEEGSDEE